MATWHSEILITTRPLQTRPNRWSGAAGASVDFWGVVRTLEDGREIWAQVTREEAQQLELTEGQILSVRLPAPRVFSS